MADAGSGTTWEHYLLKASAALLALLLSVSCAASTIIPANQPEPEGFAIYLTSKKIASTDILAVDLDGVALQEAPVLTVADIVAYARDTHEVELTPLAYERIGGLDVSTSGLPFVVCVDRQPVYGGAFWVSFSSMSFPGVVIDTLPAQVARPIRIQLGYPESPELFVGEDRRSDPAILRSLEEAGKLR